MLSERLHLGSTQKEPNLTIQERILAYLAQHPEGVDDDTITEALELAQRQQANQRCRNMEKAEILIRRRVDGKIRNYLASASPAPTVVEVRIPNLHPNERPWSWEGNVQAKVVAHLQNLGYRIEFAADTASKQPGKDIVATAPSGHALWISAKGYPVGTVKTNPPTQARHWFSHALFDLILWHGEDSTVVLALALPDQPTYQKLASRVKWLLAELNANIYWVNVGGQVTMQES